MESVVAPSAASFAWLSACLCAGMLVAIELGRRLGQSRARRDPDSMDKGTGAIDSAIFALFGLLLAFTFSGAAGRFDTRRELITQEANAIGTAYLRLDLLPAAQQDALRPLYRRYVTARLDAQTGDHPGLNQDYQALQRQIWELTLTGLAAHQGSPITNAVLDPVNAMIDITSTRAMAAQTHPPIIIFVMLCTLALVSAVLAGYGSWAAQRRHWLHAGFFCLMVSGTVYVILDIEYPRAGLIRVDAADQLLRDLLADMR